MLGHKTRLKGKQCCTSRWVQSDFRSHSLTNFPPSGLICCNVFGLVWELRHMTKPFLEPVAARCYGGPNERINIQKQGTSRKQYVQYILSTILLSSSYLKNIMFGYEFFLSMSRSLCYSPRNPMAKLSISNFSVRYAMIWQGYNVSNKFL